MIRRTVAIAALAVVLAASGALLLPRAAVAQEDLLEMLRSDIKTQKVAILTAAMEFTPQEAETFWPIYREYDVELSKIGDARIALIKDYAANYENMTEAKAKELTERSFKLEEDLVKLRRTYYKKFEKAINSSTATRFVQAERQIALLIDTQIAAEIPLIGKPAQ